MAQRRNFGLPRELPEFDRARARDDLAMVQYRYPRDSIGLAIRFVPTEYSIDSNRSGVRPVWAAGANRSPTGLGLRHARCLESHSFSSHSRVRKESIAKTIGVRREDKAIVVVIVRDVAVMDNGIDGVRRTWIPRQPGPASLGEVAEDSVPHETSNPPPRNRDWTDYRGPEKGKMCAVEFPRLVRWSPSQDGDRGDKAAGTTGSISQQALATSRPIFSVHVRERNDSDGVRPRPFHGSRPWPSA